VNEGNWLNFTITTTDADSDTLTYGTNASKGTLTTNSYSWQTTYSDSGVYTWYFNTTDNYSAVATETITVTVSNIPQTPPTPVISTVTTGNFYVNTTWTAGAGNVTDGYNSTNGTTWINNTLTYRNTTLSPHAWQNLTIYAWNSTDNVLSTALTNNTQIPNNVITISNISASYSLTEGQQLYIDANYADADSDTGTFNRNFSEGSFDTATGILTWDTTDGNQGVYNFQINVSDGYGSVSYTDFVVTVSDSTPTAPTNIQNSTWNFGVLWNWTKGSNSDFTVVHVNDTWKENSTDNEYNHTGAAHGTYEVQLREWNATLGVYSTWVNQTAAIPNNVPVLDAIGDKSADEGTWLNFSVSGTDADSDVLICDTNATKGTLSNCNFNWSTAYTDAGIYYWNFNISDGYGGIDDETIMVTINEMNFSSNITAWYNSINGWNQTAMSINVGNSATFNVTVNQTATNISWTVAGGEEQNTSSLEFTRYFGTLGEFNVTAQAFNENGSSNIIYTVVTVVSSGGGGIVHNYAYGWVKWDNGTPVNTATIFTSEGNAYTDSNGYYIFGYLFHNGDTYNFNITKSGIWDNHSVTFTTNEIVNGTLTAPTVAGEPNITSWGNDNTSDDTLSFTVPKNTNITFNATANQTITTWIWTGATQINGSGSEDTYAYKNFTSTGIKTVLVNGTNTNGTTQTVTWTITVQGATGLTLSGYVYNVLDVPLENARIYFNGTSNLTNNIGYYEFTNVTGDTYAVVARAIGYRNQTNTSSVEVNTTINFTMNERKAPMKAPGFGILLLFISLISIYSYMKRGLKWT